jgi:hypothetical protein
MSKRDICECGQMYSLHDSKKCTKKNPRIPPKGYYKRFKKIEKILDELPKKVYVCGVDWQHEIGEAPDVIVYPSIESLKKHRTCWKECGIIELEVKKVRTVTKGKRTW